MQEDSKLTMVVSVMEPKLLMKMLQVTFTGGPVKSRMEVNTKTKLLPKRYFLSGFTRKMYHD